ncbi:MAG: beta-L-arabinofuranosidase domain-containing protein [Christensenellales bacterium]
MNTPLRLPDLNRITIKDDFWSHYTDMVARVIVPYQWDILNDKVPEAKVSHCLDNFRIAAGELDGEHKGVVFIDTDVYKWLEAVAYCIQNGSGAGYEEIADEVIALIGRAQQSDGYLNTYYTLVEPDACWSNLVEGHELYSAGYLIEAAIAYYQATNKDALLKVARRFADLICRMFGPDKGQIKGYPGHQEIELALVRLYRCTGEKKYLSCARFFIEERGKEPNYLEAEIKGRGGCELFPEFEKYELKYSQAHMEPKKQRTAEGHAVRAVYMYCAMADLAYEYQDEKMLKACRTLWDNVTQKRMFITGGIGSSSFFERFTTDYHLPNNYAYCETCASVGLALFGRRMAHIERDASYYDTVERALYNTVLAGISVDGDRYFYVNPLEVWPDACLPATSLGHVMPERQRWFNVACCPTNVARTLASLGQYIYAVNDSSIYVNLFISSIFEATVSGSPVTFDMDSKLMQSGKVAFRVGGKGGSFSLAVRIPEYAQKTDFLMDGEIIRPVTQKGYAVIEINTADEHVIEMQMDISPKWVTADPRVRDNTGKIALIKGPCVYCLEETDNGENLASVYVSPDAAVNECVQTGLPGNLPALTYQGGRLKQLNRDEKRLYDTAGFLMEPVTLKAIPYCLWCNRQPGEMIVWQKAQIK